MRKKIIVVLFLLFATPAYANKFPWSGVDFKLELDGQIALNVKKTFFARGAMVGLIYQSEGLETIITYGGIKWRPLHWLSLSGLAGYAINWRETPIAFNATALIELGFFKERLTFLLDSELLCNNFFADYLGYASVDYRPMPWVNVGGQIEYLYNKFYFGPHLGFTFGAFHLETRYFFYNYEGWRYNLKLFVGISFGK